MTVEIGEVSGWDIGFAVRTAKHRALGAAIAMIKAQGPSLHVIQLKNWLRQRSFAELAQHPAFRTTTFRFRGRPVCVAIAKIAKPEGCLAFLIRGSIRGGRVVQEAGFVKYPNGSWAEIRDHDAAGLRQSILAAAPRGLGP